MGVAMIELRWIARWPELFPGLTDLQVRGVVQAIDNNLLDGWDHPQRDDIEFSTLYRLADHFGVPVSDLLAE